MTRRAQMEMVGLVFVVVILVLGIVLYVSFSQPRGTNTAAQVMGQSSFLNAMLETQVPECGVSISRLAQACIQNEGFCGDACDKVQFALDRIVNMTLIEQGVKYNISIEGTGIMNYSSDCKSSDNRTRLGPGAQAFVTLNGGTRQLVLYTCR